MSFEQAVNNLEATNADLVKEVVRVRDAAMGLNNVYPDVTTGRQATDDGKYFAVPGTGTTYMTLYRVNGASADEISRYPSQAAVDAAIQDLQAHESSTTAHAASAITYDNSASNSPETKVQGAIDDIYDRIKAKPYGPGPQTLQAGDMTDGFFGEVSAEELFSGDELAAILAVTQGTAQNSNAGWLKFACDNKVLFVAKQAFRHSISWDHLYSRGIVYGTDDNGANPRNTATNQLTKVSALGYDFKVRLLTGGNADPVDVSDSRFFTDNMVDLDLGAGSEWNRLMYRVHQDVPTSDGTDGMRADRHGGPQVGGNWASYTNADLNIDGNGRAGWCQETTTDNSADRVIRGTDDVAFFRRSTASATYSYYGWRPALELITNH